MTLDEINGDARTRFLWDEAQRAAARNERWLSSPPEPGEQLPPPGFLRMHVRTCFLVLEVRRLRALLRQQLTGGGGEIPRRVDTLSARFADDGSDL